MQLHTETVPFDVEGTPCEGLFLRPARVTTALPGVLLIQEAWGVDPHIADVARRFAEAGYAVFAPDLFAYGGKPAPLAPARVEAAKAFLDTVPPSVWFDPAVREAELAKRPEAEAAPLRETFGLLLPKERPWARYVATLKAARTWLAANGSAGRKVGSVGFCMGGALSLRLACADPALAAAVVFYGFPPPSELFDTLRAPVLGLYAEHDPNINAQLPAQFEAMRVRGRDFEQHLYAGAKHAFFNDTRQNYDVHAARDAWARTLEFLARTLA